MKPIDTVRLVFLPRPGVQDGRFPENPLGTPVVGTEGGGTYAVTECGFFFPYVTGDIVTAELNGDSEYVVTGVEQIQNGHHIYLESTEQEVLDHLTRQLVRHGVGIRAECSGNLNTFFPARFTLSAALKLLESGRLGGDLAMDVLDTDARLEELSTSIHPAVDRRPPWVVQTDYWVGDDSAWKTLGCTDPDTLARIQARLYEDPRILATIRKGGHQTVLDHDAYLMELADPDPFTLPAHAGHPLLEDPWPGMS